ncbi:MAG: HAD family phosphatase [Acidobacteria bacterium]|nr:HAD family phosphatase [Acidobacteriota bacterium]
MPKALLFDLGDVIIGLDFRKVYEAAATLSRFSAEEIPRVISRANLASPYERGEMSNDEFHRRFCDALQIEIDYGPFEQLWADMFQPRPLLPDALFNGLKRNHRLLLLSNTNDIHFRFIRQHYPLLRHFDDFVLSYEVGVMKPDAGIYSEAVRRTGAPPPECFFVDDKQINVDAAREAGIDAVRFEGHERLESELRQRGVRWE